MHCPAPPCPSCQQRTFSSLMRDTPNLIITALAVI
nr:MAG TPA: deaminase [Caudoviricetes sp.]